ncbi:heavy-metal-associated domain-containing protein [Niallia sp. XMNu-256]|uniref:heavy-metal-associated domain-containing protein n=1 Tax=Niallia sp. XMNu-256 TaxID=3082444 RepID=UPI0030D3659A
MMYQITLYVLEISCLKSFHSIEKEIKGLGGIISFKSSLPKGKLVIKFKPSLISSLQIINMIEEKGLVIFKKEQREYCYGIYN